MENTPANIQQTANNTVSKMETGAKVIQFATDCIKLLARTYDEIKDTEACKRISASFKKNKPAENQLQPVQQTTALQTEISREEFKALQDYAQKMLEALNERNLLTADAMITVKNNLNVLDVRQQEIKEAVIQMAQKVSDRFNRLEERVDRLEDSQSLMLWVDGLKYDETYKTLPQTIRFLKIAKDFYIHKSSNYNREHLLLVRKALNSADLDYKSEISLGGLVDSLVDELQDFEEQRYLEITKVRLADDSSLSGSELSDLLPVPSFSAVMQMTESKSKLNSTVSLLEKKYKIPYAEALKEAIKNDIAESNSIDMNVKMTVSDLCIELISCYSAIPDLVEETKPKHCKACGKEIKFPEYSKCPYCGADWETGCKTEIKK